MKFRRLALAGSAAAVALAMTGTTIASAASAKQNIQIFSWWTAGGEADGLKALLQLFEHDYPNVMVTNEAVAGGAGSNAKAVLANRMQAGNPPDTFQVHQGAELAAWINGGYMQPLDSLYKSQGWYNVFPKGLIAQVSKNGHPYAVPVDIHRGNVLWYNPGILKKYHLSVPTTFAAFFKDAAVLKAHNITPLALGDTDTWEATMLWENVLLGTVGPATYDKVWKGQVSFNSPGVKQSVETFVKMLGYVNTNHSALQWQDASQLVSNGQAAFNLMGDWAKGFYTSKGLKPVSGFGWADFPGTKGDFEVISDTFGIPKGAKDVAAVTDFLKVLGSKAGQDAFNPKKGSIAARTDANPAVFDVYSRHAMVDFKKDILVPSLAHGSAANPGFANAANQAMQILVGNHNVAGFINALDQAAKQNPLNK